MPRGPQRIRTPEGKLNGISERVREAREAAALTQTELAARVGSLSEWNPSREDINRVERGTRIVSDLECSVLALALGCDAAWLILNKTERAEAANKAADVRS